MTSALLQLNENSEKVIGILEALEANVSGLEQKRKLWQTAGVVSTTLGSTVAAALWAMAYVDYDNFSATIAMAATAVGVCGAIIKTGTWYLSSRSNKAYLAQLEDCLSSDHGKEVIEMESYLNEKFLRIIHILKELYGDRGSSHRNIHQEGEVNSENGDSEEDDEKSPMIISVMETADSAACAPDVINTLLDYSSDLGVESLEVLEQTYDAATSSLGEIISFGILEGAANGLSLVLSTYEVYRLVGSWNKENPTAQKIKDLINSLQKKRQTYRDTKKSIEVIDTFMKLRLRKNIIN